MGRSERDHPRVPADVGEFVSRIAAELRTMMIRRYDDSRVIGWGAANRLLLVYGGLVRPEGSKLELNRLDCLRDVLKRETERPHEEALA